MSRRIRVLGSRLECASDATGPERVMFDALVRIAEVINGEVGDPGPLYDIDERVALVVEHQRRSK